MGSHRLEPFAETIEATCLFAAPRQAWRKRSSPQHRIGGHRDKKEGDSERNQKGRDDGNADMVSHQLNQEIIGKDEGQEDRDRRQGGGEDGTPDLARTLRHRAFGRTSGGRKAVDILQDHHAIIQQHTDRQRHTDQCKTVDRNSRPVEEIERRIDGDRDGQGDKEHQPEVLQEEPEDDDGKQAPHNREVNDLVDVVLHRLRLIVLNHDREVKRGKLLVQAVDHFDRTVGKLDQIGLRVGKQGDGDGIFTVNSTVACLLFHIEENGGDVFQQYGARSDNDIFEVGNFGIRRVDMDEIFPVRLVSITDKRFLLGILRQEAADTERSQIEGFTGIGIELHLDGLLAPTVDIDGSDAVDIFQVGPYLFLH